MTPVIVVNDLHKRYPHAPEEALAGISLSIPAGGLFGCIGADGAGKSTLFSICATLQKPGSGMVQVLGKDVTLHAPALRNAIGYMPQRFSLYQDLTVAENLAFFAAVFGVNGSARDERIGRLLTFSRLGAFTRRRAGHLSGGMKQKLALCCALVHAPQLLMLDEPTTGVDPLSRREFFTLLRELVSQNVSVVLSTPYMDEARLCDSLAILHKGAIIAQGTPQELQNAYPLRIFHVCTHDAGLLSWPADTVLPPGVRLVYPSAGRLVVAVENEEAVSAARTFLGDMIPEFSGLEPASATIEDVFIEKIT